jgi:phospholipid/cholesterol/gamma-HCH transport system substrate-binding protein
MEARREQVFVGLFVVIAVALLLVTVFSLSGALAASTRTYHAEFRNAAGLEPGGTVRYEGGPKVGRIEKLRIDPADPSLIDMEFSVRSDLPVKTDSHVAILSFSPLGDNHLEIKAGSPGAQRAPDGAVLPSDPYVGFNELTAQINQLTPQAKELLANLNDRVTQLKVTIDRVNDLLNDRNRQNVSASLADLHGMLEENRPQIKHTLNNVSAASDKIGPLLDQLHKAADQANDALKKADDILGENREDIRASVQQLRQSLATVSDLVERLDQIVDNNTDNIDQILNNLRVVSQNLKEFSDEIKRRPSSLVNPAAPRDRRPGEKP